MFVLLLACSTSSGVALAAGGSVAASLDDGDTAVTTYHNDNVRSGQNLKEVKLNTTNVNVNTFGKRVSYPVDGQVYGQPLFIPGVSIGDSSYNVVYVVTENDSVYAFDADQTTASSPLWHTSFINPSAGITTIPVTDVYGKYAG